MTLPPYAGILGLTVERGPDGAPELIMPFSNDVLGRPGFVHGGALGGLLEMAAVAALDHALSGAGEGGGGGRIKPINLTVDFMRGGRERPTRARGIDSRLGARVANVDAVAWQDDPDRPVARGRLTYLIARP